MAGYKYEWQQRKFWCFNNFFLWTLVIIYKCAQRSAHQSFVSMQTKMVFPVDIFNLKKRELNLVQEILLNYSNFLLHVIKDTKQKLFNKKFQIYVSIASILTPNHSRVLIWFYNRTTTLVNTNSICIDLCINCTAPVLNNYQICLDGSSVYKAEIRNEIFLYTRTAQDVTELSKYLFSGLLLPIVYIVFG